MTPFYRLTITSTFSAAHALTIRGEREPVHGHDWRVRVTVAGPQLDEDGLLCDFHLLERRLEIVLAPFRNADLNATPPFDRINPSAEHVVRHVAETLAAALPAGVRLESVAVTEAPGCEATWVADGA